MAASAGCAAATAPLVAQGGVGGRLYSYIFQMPFFFVVPQDHSSLMYLRFCRVKKQQNPMCSPAEVNEGLFTLQH